MKPIEIKDLAEDPAMESDTMGTFAAAAMKPVFP